MVSTLSRISAPDELMRDLDHNLNHAHDCLFSSVPCRSFLHNKYNSWYEIAWHDVHMCGPGWWSNFYFWTVCCYIFIMHNYVVICYCVMLYRLHGPTNVTCLCICSLENFSWMSPHPFPPHSLRWQFHWQRGDHPGRVRVTGETPAPGRLHLLMMTLQRAAHED